MDTHNVINDDQPTYDQPTGEPTTFQVVQSGLSELPDSEYFSAQWTLPDPTFFSISRRGDDWRADLRETIVAELQWWIDAITKPEVDGGGIEDCDVVFGIHVPIAGDDLPTTGIN